MHTLEFDFTLKFIHAHRGLTAHINKTHLWWHIEWHHILMLCNKKCDFFSTAAKTTLQLLLFWMTKSHGILSSAASSFELQLYVVQDIWYKKKLKKTYQTSTVLTWTFIFAVVSFWIGNKTLIFIPIPILEKKRNEARQIDQANGAYYASCLSYDSYRGVS